MSTTFCRAVKPPCNQILRIDREGMIDDVTCISHNKKIMPFVPKRLVDSDIN